MQHVSTFSTGGNKEAASCITQISATESVENAKDNVRSGNRVGKGGGGGLTVVEPTR